MMRKIKIERIELRKVWKTFTESFIYASDVKWFSQGDIITDGEGNFYYVADTEWLDGGVLITYVNNTKLEKESLLYRVSDIGGEVNVYNRLRKYKREYNLNILLY